MESELLAARVRDAIRLCDVTSMPKFIGFLTSEEAATVRAVTDSKVCKAEFFGGYEAAERVMLGIFPDWCNEREEFFPLSAVTFLYREADKLSHRDFLGALMSLGIKREKVGDILVGNGRTVAFLSKDIVRHVLDNLEKAGNVGLTLSEGFSEPLPNMTEPESFSKTVASCRLDAVLAAIIGCSRNGALEYIDRKLVSVNSVLEQKSQKNISAGDKITVRGKGRFIIETADTRTKKGRIVLNVKKYI